MRRARTALQFLAVLGAAIALAKLAGPAATYFQQRRLPQGWRTVRPPHEVSGLALDGDTVWAGGADGLFRIDRRTARLQALHGAPRMTYVRDVLLSRSGALWVAHREGVSRMETGKWRTWTRADGLPQGAFTALCEAGDGSMWIGGEWGLLRLVENSPVTVATADQLRIAGIDVIVRDSSGALWLASSAPQRGGLVRFDGTQFTSWTARPELPHSSVSAVLETRDGSLWFGTGFGRQGGAAALKGNAWRVLTRSSGLAGEKVRSLFEDRQGRLWIGSEYDGIALLDGPKRQVFTPDQGLSGWEVKKTIQDQDGAYWMGTEDGVTKIAAVD